MTVSLGMVSRVSEPFFPPGTSDHPETIPSSYVLANRVFCHDHFPISPFEDVELGPDGKPCAFRFFPTRRFSANVNVGGPAPSSLLRL